MLLGPGAPLERMNLTKDKDDEALGAQRTCALSTFKALHVPHTTQEPPKICRRQALSAMHTRPSFFLSFRLWRLQGASFDPAPQGL